AGVGLFATDGSVQFTGFGLPRALWDFACAKQRPLYWASTLQVYGSTHHGPGATPDQVKPLSAFGAACRAFEVFAAKRQAEPDAPPVATALRLGSVFGHEQHKGSVASLPHRAVAGLAAGRPVEVWRSTDPALVDGGHQRDWIAADDAGRMIAAVMTAGLQGPFDIGSGRLASAIEVVQAASRVTRVAPATIAVDPPSGAALQSVAADPSRLIAAGIDT
ncbi:MAG: NAD-dependent epimerase/dehydratase family protein, partial [Hyphomonadaceae bacterium]|nr:NAD-dependent epimerase/dehydratase family protein [Hyphomonadaceae bacterium]